MSKKFWDGLVTHMSSKQDWTDKDENFKCIVEALDTCELVNDSSYYIALMEVAKQEIEDRIATCKRIHFGVVE